MAVDEEYDRNDKINDYLHEKYGKTTKEYDKTKHQDCIDRLFMISG
jgi:hypothetical protein